MNRRAGRPRLSIDLAVVVGCILLAGAPLAGALYLRFGDHAFASREAEDIAGLASWAARALAGRRLGPDELMEPDALPAIAGFRSAAVYWGGRWHARTVADPALEQALQRLLSASPGNERSVGWLEGGYRYVLHPFARDGEAGVVAVVASMEGVASYKDGLSDLLYRAGLAYALVVVAIAAIVHRLFTRPLRRLALEAASFMEAGVEEAPSLSCRSRPDELGLLSRSLQASLESLKARNQAVSAYSADIAHELKNPLAGLRAALELMPSGCAPAEGALLAVARREADRMERLLASIREMGDLEREPCGSCHPGALLRELVAYYGIRGSLVLFSEPLPPTLLVPVSEERLGRILRNLVDNAFDFSPPGTPVELRVFSGEPRGTLSFAVEDMGRGLSAEEAEACFRRFYSTRRGDGSHSGLGLAIARSLAVASGGSLRHEPRRGGGSRFILELPLG